MSAPLVPIAAAVAAPLADFFSWGLDSIGKLLRGEIDSEQVLAEVEQRFGNPFWVGDAQAA